jgi:3',5'-cyclic AMP phosphodiesterase CpdA
MKKFIILFFCSIILIACSDLEYSPNQSFDKKSPTNLNFENFLKLQQASSDDTIRFIIFGDTQKSQKELDIFIDEVNQMKGVDMVFLAGDISEFGLLQESKWVAKELKKLNVPFFGVIGNHDIIANGRAVFQRMFGELNYSFDYQGIRFIAHDTNGREYKFNGKVPNIDWINKQLEGANDLNGIIGISHIRPQTSDFDPKLNDDYITTFNSSPKILASFHAHEHNFGKYTPIEEGTPFLVTTAVGERGFVLAEIINGKLSYEKVSF